MCTFDGPTVGTAVGVSVCENGAGIVGISGGCIDGILIGDTVDGPVCVLVCDVHRDKVRNLVCTCVGEPLVAMRRNGSVQLIFPRARLLEHHCLNASNRSMWASILRHKVTRFIPPTRLLLISVQNPSKCPPLSKHFVRLLIVGFPFLLPAGLIRNPDRYKIGHCVIVIERFKDGNRIMVIVL